MKTRRFATYAFPTALAVFMGGTAFAQNYPVKPIRLIIAQAPGSATDTAARAVVNKLGEFLGQPVVIEARPGAGGTVGTEFASKLPPDGYNLFMANNSTHGTNPAVYPKLSYDAVKDFAPIVFVGGTAYILCVHPSLPVTTLKQFIAFAKSRPGQINYASAGNGSTHQLAGELLKQTTGIDIVHVPYKGSPPAMTALLGGEVSIMFATVPVAGPHVKSGRVRAIGVTTPERTQLVPGVPTLNELGLKGFEMQSWFGILAPAAVPRTVVTRVNTETNKALALPEVKGALAAQGIETKGGTPEQFGDYIKNEIAKITKIARSANIKAE